MQLLEECVILGETRRGWFNSVKYRESIQRDNPEVGQMDDMKLGWVTHLQH